MSWECNGMVNSAILTKVLPHVCADDRLICQMTKAPAEQKAWFGALPSTDLLVERK